MVTVILGEVVVVTDAVSPVISFVKSSPVADALLRKVPAVELVVTVKVSVDDPDALMVDERLHVSSCPLFVGSVVLRPEELPST